MTKKKVGPRHEPFGRPTKYSDEFPDMLIKEMSEGLSVIRFSALIGISKTTFYEWVRDYPDFAAAFAKGKSACESYWEQWLVEHLCDKDVKTGMVKLFMANRFGWTEKTEVKQDASANANAIALVAEIADFIKSKQKDV